jgi:hypothetical protein
MLRVSKLKTVGRVVSMVFLLPAMIGPWFADSHPATEETCPPPLVWLGDGYCACRISFTAFVEDVISGQSSLWLLCLSPTLPILSTLLLLLIGERRWLWVCHLTAWGLAAVYALLWFVGIWYVHRGALILWGAGLGGVVAVTTLVWEILMYQRARGLNGRSKVDFPVDV